MKYTILFLVLSIFTPTHSQSDSQSQTDTLSQSATQSRCKYSMIEYDNTTGKGILKTLPITLDYYETPYNGRIILAYLVRVGNQYFIELEITNDSSTRELTPICFEKGARLSFSLKNNSTVSVTQIEDRICGVKTYDRDSKFSSVSNYASFILTQDSFDELIESEVVLMKISSTDYQKSYVIKDELEEFRNDDVIVTNPSRFFIDHIQCLTNPKFK